MIINSDDVSVIYYIGVKVFISYESKKEFISKY